MYALSNMRQDAHPFCVSYLVAAKPFVGLSDQVFFVVHRFLGRSFSMTKMIPFAAVVGVTLAAALLPSEAQAWFGRGGGSCGSSGGYSSNGGGSFGGLFSRRNHNSCYNECDSCGTESSSCGSSGGSQGVIYESHEHMDDSQQSPSNPPPAPRDPGGNPQAGQGAAVTATPTVAMTADRRQSAFVASNRRLGRILR
jgi:hypothetical protein